MLSKKADEAITTIDLIGKLRSGIAFRKENPSEISVEYDQARIKTLQERIDDLFADLSFGGYEVEFHGTTITVLKDGQKWLEKMDWTEYPVS